jgi:hypothetical protein
MICQTCTEGGLANSRKDYEQADKFHEACQGCTCGHRTGDK